MAEQAQEAVKKALVDCIALYSQGAIQECAAFYAPDGVIMPPGFPPAVGQEAILKGLKYSYDTNGVRSFDYEIKECQVLCPDAAFTFHLSTAKDAEGASKGNMKTLLIWKKIDGIWRQYREMHNSMP